MRNPRGCYGKKPEKLDSLGQRIKAVRMGWGWTQRQLAEAIHSNPKTIWHWEQGRQSPSDAALGALSLLFGISPEGLLSGNGFELPLPPRQMGSMLVSDSYATDMLVLPKSGPGDIMCIDQDTGDRTLISATKAMDLLRKARQEGRPLWLVVGRQGDFTSPD